MAGAEQEIDAKGTPPQLIRTTRFSTATTGRTEAQRSHPRRSASECGGLGAFTRLRGSLHSNSETKVPLKFAEETSGSLSRSPSATFFARRLLLPAEAGDLPRA